MKRANGCAQKLSGSKKGSDKTDGKIFNDANGEWKERRATLKSRLTEDEYTAVQMSTLNAHYTSPTIILKSSYGIGNFFEMQPERMQDSHLFAVELDGITGRIGSLGDVPADGRILLTCNAYT